MSDDGGAAIEDFYLEERLFPPPEGFADQAVVADPSISERAERDVEGFWAEQARALDWFDEWHTVLEWDLPFARWFVGGTLNVSHNCLDRHVAAGLGERVAIHWEGEPGRHEDDHVRRVAGRCRAVRQRPQGPRGPARGDRVAIYMPMIPELPVAMLACTRIGAPHSVVFGGFSPDALRDRINDAAGQGPRHRRRWMAAGCGRGAQGRTPTPRWPTRRRSSTWWWRGARATPGAPTPMTEGRDHWWDDLMAGAAASCAPEHMDAEDLLYLLYTSGTTAKPKGIMHSTGGYLTQVAFTHRAVFDLHPERDVYWCAADIGWVTGPQLHRLRAARQRRHQRHVRGHPRLPRQGPVVGHHRALRGHDPVLRAHGHPDLHEVGHRIPRAPRHVVAAACSDRWASPSIPRRGSGTGPTSGEGVARSSTRGGRPRPAPS